MKKSNVIFEAIALLVIIACLLVLPSHGQLNCSGGCGGAVKVEFANVTTQTLSGVGIVLASVSSDTLGAGELAAGQTLDITWRIDSINNDTTVARPAQYGMHIDGAQPGGWGVCAPTNAPATGGNAVASFHMRLTVLTAGAGGTATLHGECMMDPTATSVVIPFKTTNATISFNTTTSHTFGMMAKWVSAPDTSSTHNVRSALGVRYN